MNFNINSMHCDKLGTAIDFAKRTFETMNAEQAKCVRSILGLSKDCPKMVVVYAYASWLCKQPSR